MSSKHCAGGLAGGHQLLLAADLARRSCLTPLLHASRAMRARDVPYGTGGDTHWLPNLYPFPGHVFRGCRTGGMHFDCTTRNQVKREPTISWTEARCGRRVADLPCCARLSHINVHIQDSTSGGPPSSTKAREPLSHGRKRTAWSCMR